MKKIFEFWVPLFAPSFLFVFSYCMLRPLTAEVFAVAVAGSILFLAGQLVFYKFLKNKIPDIVGRTNILLDYVAAISGLYISGIISSGELKVCLIFSVFILIVGIMFIFQGIKR